MHAKERSSHKHNILIYSLKCDKIMIKKTKPIIIVSIVIATVLLSVMTFGKWSFAVSTGSSTGSETVLVTLTNAKGVPLTGLDVVASCKNCSAKPSAFNLEAPGIGPVKNWQDVKIEGTSSGSYDISVHHIQTGFKPTYTGHCHGTVSPGKKVSCDIQSV